MQIFVIILYPPVHQEWKLHSQLENVALHSEIVTFLIFPAAAKTFASDAQIELALANLY